MTDPGVPQPGRDSRTWPVLLAASVTAAVVLAFLAVVGPSSDSEPSAAGSPSATAAGRPSSVAPSPSPTTSARSSPAGSATPTGTPSSAATPTTVPAAPPTPVSKPVAAPLRRLPVVVFNQTTRRYLAAETAAKIEQGGWTVVGVDNWVGTVPSTTVYYPDGFRQDARDLADYLGVDRIRSKVSPMRDDRLTVILMTDYPG